MGASALVPILGSTDGGLRIDLVRAAADAVGRFVVLHEGRFSRVYLAELRTAEGGPLRRFAWKVQTDASQPATGHGRPLTNLDVDDLWQRELDALQRVHSPNVVARVPVPAAMLDGRPIVHCGKVDRYFHPVCAVTGGPLTVCRDDDFLAECGLLEYSKDTWRYLYGGGAEHSSRTFYRLAGANGERPRDGIVVRTGTQLYRDWSRLVHADPASPQVLAASPSLPCLSCEHRMACYPAEAGAERLPAEDELQPVSFYDFRAAALELLDFDYDELCDLLGGAEPDEVARAAGARGALLAERCAALRGSGQWLFGADGARFPLEVLRQKLTAFQEVVEGLEAVHKALGRPHLAVAPSNVMARLAPLGSAAPVRWGLQVQLIDLGSPMRLAAAHGRDVPCLLEPGGELREDLRNRAYLSPDLQVQDGQVVAMSVACQKAVVHQDKRRLVVEAQGATNLKQFRAGDVVCIAQAGPGGGDLQLWAHLDEIRKNGLVASAEVAADHPCLRWEGRKFEARLSFFRHFGPPVDLYGLGMLLFRTLLVNDQQGLDDVEAAVGKCLRRLADEVATGSLDERTVLARLHQVLHGKDVRSYFDSGHVLQRRAAREDYAHLVADGVPPIDAGLWQALLGVAFKLVTRWKGFSYSHGHAEGSPFLLRAVREDVEALRRRVHVDLFTREARDAAIAAACAELLEQLRAEMLADSPAAATPTLRPAPDAGRGFRLLVQKEGEPGPPQEYSFDREQVTIGRREVENLVRLNDPMVSSAHAVIELQAEGHVVIDRNSTNGTEVDGIRLPVDVAQPLQDGSVIAIRPFTLTFRSGSGAARLDATAVVQTMGTERLLDQLHAEFARHREAPAAQRHEALRQVLVRAREIVGPAAMHGKLEEILAGTRRGPVSPPSAPAEQMQAEFFTSAHRSLAQLSRSLLGKGDFQTPADVQGFASRLSRFVETTSQWIERTLELRRALGRHLELGGTSTAVGRSGARTAADVRHVALAWEAGGSSPEQAASFLTKFYDDVLAIVEGLLVGSQQVRKAVRERLDPARLVELAGREAKFSLLVNAAANSNLWKLYVQTFQEVTEGKQFELELDRLLQKSLQDHRPKH